mmetsp:Transcript_10986/g.27784  ORF Transcript_10986/g.27784 Transcript_10986/m.27784 type:complete len:246 (-) Transcript_10986:1235-1972(-)
MPRAKTDTTHRGGRGHKRKKRRPTSSPGCKGWPTEQKAFDDEKVPPRGKRRKSGEGAEGPGDEEQASPTALERHKELVRNYCSRGAGAGGEPSGRGKTLKTDYDMLRETYRFNRTDEDDAGLGEWERKLAKGYYTSLFREFAVADLSRWSEGRVGLRWRRDKEVLAGKGERSCSEKACAYGQSQEEAREGEGDGGLQTFEVNFGYVEEGAKKNTLVKVRLCPMCAPKLTQARAMKAAKAGDGAGS